MAFFLPSQFQIEDQARPSIEWEEPACLLCSNRKWSQLVEAPDQAVESGGRWFVVVQCSRCGLCFTNPRPSATSMAQFYGSEYVPHQTRDRPKSRRFPFGSLSPSQRQRGSQLDLRWHGRGRLLDFGCGAGSFLERMHQQGWNVTGLDISALAVRQAQSGLGLPVLLGSLPHPELAPQSFDVITMWQSLEHVHDPQAVLRQAHELLVAGGKLFVSVPNIDSLPFRWFGPAWYGLDLPRHLTHFTPITLQVMVEGAGFRMRKVRMVRHSSWLRASARLTYRFPLNARWRRWLTSKPISRMVTSYSSWTRQSDCILLEAVKEDRPRKNTDKHG
jgi:2-polyprenyl-3-methyl-5-hydroxy-6-metoxy-1,4-benzoquinol methylase